MTDHHVGVGDVARRKFTLLRALAFIPPNSISFSSSLNSLKSTWPLLSTRNLPLSLSSLLFQTSPTSRRTLKDARPCRSSTSHPIPFRGEKKMEGASNLIQSATLGAERDRGGLASRYRPFSVHIQFPLIPSLSRPFVTLCPFSGCPRG